MAVMERVCDMVELCGFSPVDPDPVDAQRGCARKLSRTWTKTVDVAFHGQVESSFETILSYFPQGNQIRAEFYKNGRLAKSKIYDSSPARAFNAISQTVENAGFCL